MGAIRATAKRTMKESLRSLSSGFIFCCFLVLSALSFVLGLGMAEEGFLTLPVVWAAHISPILPVFVVLLAMGSWSDERASGRIDMMLSIAVRERDFVIGKFLGVWFLSVVGVVCSHFVCLLTLKVCLPDASLVVRFIPSLLAIFALVVQAMLWSAVTVMMSSFFRSTSSSMSVAIGLLVILPRAVWFSLSRWFNEFVISGWGEYPPDAHAIDLASGILPIGTLSLYVLLTIVALIIATKVVFSYRFVGCGVLGLRSSTYVAIFLALLFAASSVLFFVRVNPQRYLAEIGRTVELSPRTRDILSRLGKEVKLTCFMSRNHPRFRDVERLVREFVRESAMHGGMQITDQFVDPHWDIGLAEQLVSQGIHEDSLVFSGARIGRTEWLPIDDDFDEWHCATILDRLTALPLRKVKVCWTEGHGERAFDSYDAHGMSAIARSISQFGYQNVSIHLGEQENIPDDCALIVIAGAKDEFSRREVGQLEAYLRKGGRLLVLLVSEKAGGLTSLLSSWGIRTIERPLDKARTMMGSDVIVTDFSDHTITAPLKGSRITLERPVCFQPSAVVESGSGAIRINYTSIASVGGYSVAAIIETGVSAVANEMSVLRPTRMIVVGDESFAVNGALAARGGANRDFILNCISYLSGSDGCRKSSEGRGSSVPRLDRQSRLQFLLIAAGVIPLGILVVLFLVDMRRKYKA